MPYQAIALVTVAIAFASVAVITQHKEQVRWPAWIYPAVLMIVFTAWSLGAVITEGPLGFWQNHVANMWGIQVWVDLLMAVGAAYFLLLPRARAVGMTSEVWIILICCTGSIGLFTMLARMLFLERQQASWD
ncbi:MAG: hypothetical protein AAF830_06265 [Pseudomonadota bacterium]